MRPPSDANRFPTSTTTEIDELLTRIQAELTERVGVNRHRLWFEGSATIHWNGDALRVEVRHALILNWMRQQFHSALSDAAASVLHRSIPVTFELAVETASAERRPESVRDDGGDRRATESLKRGEPTLVPSSPLPANVTLRTDVSPVATASAALPDSSAGTSESPLRRAESQPASSTKLPPALGYGTTAGTESAAVSGRRFWELSDLEVGPCNELAVTAVRQLVDSTSRFNPLYVHGGVGAGKTHLLQGLAKEFRRRHPAKTIVYISAEAFANAYTQAVRDRTFPSFRQRFRTVDLLIVDDVEFFESMRAIQEEFRHTVVALMEGGRQLVASADRHPRLLTKLDPDVTTRFVAGLVCRLDTPNLETRERIVHRKASRLPAEFAPEALAYVAQKFQRSVRDLEGALNCLAGRYALTKKRITLHAAREALADLERDCFKFIRVSDVEQAVCTLFGLKPRDLKSESRVRTVSQPRMLAMYLSRRHTQAAYSEIGEHFGGRNHSTVMAAEKKVDGWLAENVAVRAAGQQWSMTELVASLEQVLLAG